MVHGRCCMCMPMSTSLARGCDTQLPDPMPAHQLLLSPPLQAFRLLGSSLQSHVEVVRVEPAPYRVFFEEGFCERGQRGSYLDLLYDVQDMQAQLEEVEKGAGGAR